MHLTASNSWARPWPILKLVTIYKSARVILLTGFGRKVIFEKSVSRCISPPPLNTSLYSTTVQTPHGWHSKSCPWTLLFCTDTPPQRPWGHTTLDSTCPTGGLSIRTFFSPKMVPKCLVLHSHGDRSSLEPAPLPHDVSLTCSDTAALTLPQKQEGQVRKSRETEAKW